MTTFITYVLLPSGWHPVRQSLRESRADSLNVARALYRSHVTKTVQWATTVAPQLELDEALQATAPITFVENEDWPANLSSSI